MPRPSACGRLKTFPEHPLYTFFAGGVRRFDLDDLPRRWKQDGHEKSALLAATDAEAALGAIESYLAYGSEVGQPCDNPFCCG